MTFTPEQIAIIEKIVDQRISLANPAGKTKSIRDFHSAFEIRNLIRKHIGALKVAITAKEFDIVILRHELAKLTTLRSGDTEYIRSGSKGGIQTRWDSQVSNAVQRPDDWHGAALIVPSGSRRKYMFTETGQMGLGLIAS